jgi:Uma2 family endonuclease
MSSMPVPKARPVTAPAPQAVPAICTIATYDRLTDSTEIIVPASAHTLAGFRTWAKSDTFPERGRISFLNGEIFIDMSPEELETQNKVKTEVGYTVVHLNKKDKLGVFCADRTLVTNVDADLSTEPDGAFLLWESLETGLVRLVPHESGEGRYLEVEGSPDWVLEIVSNTSVRKDTRRLREHYHRANVREYWLIDARAEAINFQILVRGETDYLARVSRGGWQTSVVFNRRFRLVRQRGRLNLWEYTLQVKPVR